MMQVIFLNVTKLGQNKKNRLTVIVNLFMNLWR